MSMIELKNGQCNAYTRQGMLCTRKAEPNGLCWQHNKIRFQELARSQLRIHAGSSTL